MPDNNKKIWRMIVIAIMLGLGGWLLIQTASIPETYATKCEQENLKKEIIHRLDRMEDKIDRILER